MKYKHIIALFLIGMLFWFFAGWSKITHQAYAQTMVHISFSIIAVSCVLAVIKVLSKKDDSFLNK